MNIRRLIFWTGLTFVVGGCSYGCVGYANYTTCTDGWNPEHWNPGCREIPTPCFDLGGNACKWDGYTLDDTGRWVVIPGAPNPYEEAPNAKPGG